jgi:hypothetical protein
MTPVPEKTVSALIADLRLSDEETGGHPILPPDTVATARLYLQQLLLDIGPRLKKHIANLEMLYRGTFVPPLPRSWRPDLPPGPGKSTGFRHAEVLAEPLAQTVLEGGVDRLADADVARLLLNPHALWDLWDLIHTLLPDYWIEQMEEEGVALARANGIDLYEDFAEVVGGQIPAHAKGTAEAVFAGRTRGASSSPVEVEPNRWQIEVPAEVQARIARVAFGEATRAFQLYLVRAAGSKAQLVIAPSPTHADCALSVRFGTGEERTFVVEVPPETKIDSTLTRKEMRSDLSPTLPANAFTFTACDWQIEGDCLRLTFR